MKRLYLAGPIKNTNYDEISEWRKYVALNLNSDVVPVSPIRGAEHLRNEGNISDSYENHIILNSKSLTSKSMFDVQSSDAVLMNLFNAADISIGSMIECGWASAYNKPIILVMEKYNIHYHSILNTIAGYIVDNLDNAIEIANFLLSDEFCKKNQ